MAITNVGKNRIYASIKDLPENQSIVNGDKIIVDTEEGTCVIDYSNVRVDLEHTTFGEQFSQMVSYTSTVNAFVEQMQSDFQSMQEETATLNSKMKDMEDMMDCVKLMIKFIMGSCSSKDDEYPLEQANSQLQGRGLAMFNECLDAMNGKTFSFSRFNLYTGRI